jgi:hypothetical protein
MQCESQEYDEHQNHLQAEVITDDWLPARSTNPFISEHNQRTTLKGQSTNREEDDHAFFFLGPQQDSLSPALSATTACEISCDNTIDLATRIFYATCHKFATTAQQPPRYSFRQSLLLHSMYSKSQQILLGMETIRPTVILSGDDFMFTPPVPSMQSSLSDWAPDMADDSFLDGYAFSPDEDYTALLEEGFAQDIHSNNNPFTQSHEFKDANDVIPGNVFEAFIPVSRIQALSINDEGNSLEENAPRQEASENARALFTKELSNWFTANAVDKLSQSDDHEDEWEDNSDQDISITTDVEDDLDETASQESDPSPYVSEREQPEPQDEPVVEKNENSIPAPSLQPLLEIMQVLQEYDATVSSTVPHEGTAIDSTTSDSSEVAAGPKQVHDGIRNYISTLQSIVRQQLVDTNVAQTVTSNGKRVKTSVGFFRRWLSWLSSIIKVWKLFFLIAESLLVSFGDAILQSIIIHALGRQLESAPVIVAS